MSGWWRSKEIKAYSSKIFEQSQSSSDERQGHSTIFASALVCFCIEAGTSSPLTTFVRAWCILVYSRPASILGNYRVCKCYCKRLRFTGDANVRYFSNGDLLVCEVDIWSFANLEARLYNTSHVQELWGLVLCQSEGNLTKKGLIGDLRMIRCELTKKTHIHMTFFSDLRKLISRAFDFSKASTRFRSATMFCDSGLIQGLASHCMPAGRPAA